MDCPCLVLRGIQGAAVLNAVVTLAKVVPLLLFIALVAMAFQIDTFTLNFWGDPQARFGARSGKEHHAGDGLGFYRH